MENSLQFRQRSLCNRNSLRFLYYTNPNSKLGQSVSKFFLEGLVVWTKVLMNIIGIK